VNLRELFGERYFKGGLSNYNDYLRDHRFPRVAKALVEVFKLKGRRVLDCGSAVPYLCDELRRLGVEAIAFDISDYVARRVVSERLQDFLQADVRFTPFRDRSFYLVIASELVEHVPAEYEDLVVRELARVTGKYLLVRTPFCTDPRDRDVTHVNIHPWMYWVTRFEELGLLHNDHLFQRFSLIGHTRFPLFYDEFLVFERV